MLDLTIGEGTDYFVSSLRSCANPRYQYDGKKAKSCLLAPIEVEILMSRGSAYKIVTESGTVFPKKPNVSAPN